MPKFTKHIPVRHGFDTVWFAPGDELPEWAAGLVGEHALEQPVAEAQEAAGEDFTGGAAVEPAKAVAEEAETDPAPVAEAQEAAGPDFTKPARRTAARKK